MFASMRTPTSRRAIFASVALLALAACDDNFNLQGQDFDWDVRNLGGVFDTTDAARNLPNRPRPDNRGVISYPNYQVVVAQRGETVRQIATRLNLDANQLAAFNGVDADVALRRDEIVALPARVAEPSPATGAVTSGPIQPPSVDVTTLAGDAINRAGEQTTAPTAQAAQTGAEPTRHRVARGETAFQIARLYDVPVAALAEWNGLGSDLTVREGQQLLIPVAGATPPSPTATEAPGAGSRTPTPPSAVVPLPEVDVTPETPQTAPVAPPAPDLGTTAATPATSAPFIFPVQGSIIREYNPGRNEGIDIGVPAGTAVKAAADGTIAAITQNTNGAQIIVMRHTGNILTVYVNVDDLSVSKDTRVSQGQTIAQVAAGTPSFLHFEVRDGLESVDPADYLP
jgi:murein DD-endopeptidase MepM/ murein hydrolase activator NlpD